MSGFEDRSAVVVGVDGSEEARRALRWAAATAIKTNRPLHIVHTWLWPAFRVPLGPVPGAAPSSGLRAAAERVLQTARREVEGSWPGIDLTTVLVYGEPAVVLVDMSRDAEIVVVGSRGLGGFSGLLLGSVGLHVSSRAHCPVVVVRGEERETGAVIVGVDGSEGSVTALERAFETSAALGARLVALTTWDFPVGLAPDPSKGTYQRSLEDRARMALAQAVAPWRDKHPGVQVEEVVVQGAPASALVDASRGARLIVLGSHGAGGLRGLVLGSVSHAVLHHAHCPVMIVPRERHS